MDDLTGWGLDRETSEQRTQQAEQIVDVVLAQARQPLVAAVVGFFEKSLSPTTLMVFEIALLGLVREIGRQLLELVLNACEPGRPDALPGNLSFECGEYRRRSQKTANRNVASRFGDIVLHRYGYRSWQPGDGSIFPLEMLLGLNNSATPALVDWIGRHIATAGSNQTAVIQLLRTDCGVTMGIKRLRQCVEQLSESMEEFRQEHQVDVLLEALKRAAASTGSRKPVVSVGRDGITLREYKHSAYQVATTGTVSVYDRRGKRLITVYLAYPPELGQATMDQMLTDLITELLERYSGPLPRLAYVTDSGSNETGYFEKVLRRMDQHRYQGSLTLGIREASPRVLKAAAEAKNSREIQEQGTRCVAPKPRTDSIWTAPVLVLYKLEAQASESLTSKSTCLRVELIMPEIPPGVALSNYSRSGKSDFPFLRADLWKVWGVV